MLDLLTSGLSVVFAPKMFILIIFAVFLGTLFGALPGVSATMAVTLGIPFTYKMDAVSAIAFLVAIYCASITGGGMTAILNPLVNSYKRLWGGNEAPSYICWGHNNRSALLRIPQYKPGKGNSARMEFRALDPVANPYLAYSVLLAAGLDGIDKQMQLGEPTSDDVWELTDGERQAMGIQPLPRSLDEALKIMEKSDFVADVLGEHAFGYFLDNKHQEWEEYNQQVTPYELKKYLPKL